MSEGLSSDALRARAMDALSEVLDPELGLSVVELGLVYAVEIVGSGIHVSLTMTTPACPLGEQIVRDAESRLGAIDGVGAVAVELVWKPPWSPERMSPAAKRLLGWEPR